MKKTKKCFNSIVGITEPEDCIKEKCMAWTKMGGLEGCSFILEAVTNIISNMEDIKGKNEENDNDTDSKNDTQCGEGDPNDIDPSRKEPTASDTSEQDAEEKTEGTEVSKEVAPQAYSGDATMKPIEEGEYKGDPA